MEYLTLEEAASMLRLSPDTVARLVALGDLRAEGDELKILRSTISEYVGRPFGFRAGRGQRSRSRSAKSAQERSA